MTITNELIHYFIDEKSIQLSLDVYNVYNASQTSVLPTHWSDTSALSQPLSYTVTKVRTVTAATVIDSLTFTMDV